MPNNREWDETRVRRGKDGRFAKSSGGGGNSAADRFRQLQEENNRRGRGNANEATVSDMRAATRARSAQTPPTMNIRVAGGQHAGAITGGIGRAPNAATGSLNALHNENRARGRGGNLAGSTNVGRGNVGGTSGSARIGSSNRSNSRTTRSGRVDIANTSGSANLGSHSNSSRASITPGTTGGRRQTTTNTTTRAGQTLREDKRASGRVSSPNGARPRSVEVVSSERQMENNYRRAVRDAQRRARERGQGQR